MQSIEKKILTNVAKRGGGQIIFPQDFASYGTPDAVHKAFGRLVTSEQLLRVAQGVYCYPKIEPIPRDRLLLVSLNNSYQQSKASGVYHRANYYESARKYWKLSKDKADKVDYILGIYRGIVRIVIDVKSKSLCSVAEDGTIFKKPRFAFVGDIVKDSPYLNTDVTDLSLRTRWRDNLYSSE